MLCRKVQVKMCASLHVGNRNTELAQVLDALMAWEKRIYIWNEINNRRFSWWRLLTTTTRILHFFVSHANQGNCYENLTGSSKCYGKEKSKEILVVVVRRWYCANLLLIFIENIFHVSTYCSYRLKHFWKFWGNMVQMFSFPKSIVHVVQIYRWLPVAVFEVLEWNILRWKSLEDHTIY